MKKTIIMMFLVLVLYMLNSQQYVHAISESQNIDQSYIMKIERIAELGDLTAQEFLSDYYKRLTENSKAMYWAKKTLASKSARGALVASVIEHENGNIELSNKYSDMSAQYAFNSNEPYVASLLYPEMLRRDKKRDAFLLCKLAADYGDVDAQLFVSFFYKEGIGTKADYKKSYIYGLVVRKNGNKLVEPILDKLNENYIYEKDIDLLQKEADVLEKKIIENKKSKNLEYDLLAKELQNKISSLQ